MPAMDMPREARRAALSTLKANADLIAIVPAARIYSQRVPTAPVWPFIKFGPVQGLPIKAACTRGSVISFSVHAFAKALANETAEDYAGRIGAHVKAALDGSRATFTGGTVRYTVAEEQLLLDGAEADAFHYFAVVSARVIA